MQKDVSLVASPSPSAYLAVERGAMDTERPSHHRAWTPFFTERSEVSHDG